MQQARDAQRKSDLNAIQKALELYYFDKGTYPSTGGYCCSNWAYNNDPSPWIPGLNSDYLKKLPKDPKNSGAGPWTDGNYTYAYSSNGPHYNLVAQLEDHSDTDRCEVKNYLWVISDSGTTQGICGPPAGPNGISTVYIYLRTDYR